jgi:hypothetical protein
MEALLRGAGDCGDLFELEGVDRCRRGLPALLGRVDRVLGEAEGLLTARVLSTERRICRCLLTVRALRPARSRVDRNRETSADRISARGESPKVRRIRAAGPLSRLLAGLASIIRWSARVEGFTRFSCST